MNTALRNPFMLQEDTPSRPARPSLRIFPEMDGECRRERRERENERAETAKTTAEARERIKGEREGEGRGELETPHLVGILPCNSRCYILFVCFRGTPPDLPLSPSSSASSRSAPPSPASSLFPAPGTSSF